MLLMKLKRNENIIELADIGNAIQTLINSNTSFKFNHRFLNDTLYLFKRNETAEILNDTDETGNVINKF